MYEVFFKFYSCNEDNKPSAAFSCRHKYKIHAPECTKTRHFYFKLKKNFYLRPLPQREGDPFPLYPLRTHPPLGDLRAFGAHSCTHPLTRKSGYGRGCRFVCLSVCLSPKCKKNAIFDGTCSVVVSAQRRHRRATISDVGRRLSDRYADAVPCTQWYARTHNRNWIRSGRRNQ